MTAVAALVAATAAVVPTTERPPLGYTGGFGEETCVECHTGNEVNAFGGRVTIEGLPGAWEAGETYPLSVVLYAEETSVAGFQLSARNRDGRSAGSFEAYDDRIEVRDSAGISYVHHTREGSRPASDDRATWSFAWTAPDRGGIVAFNVTANSGNGDNSPLSDLVYADVIPLVPAGGATQQATAAIDSVRLLHDLSVLSHDSMEGRAPGTPGSLRARSFLTGELEASGAAPIGDAYAHPFEFPAGNGENLIAVVPGSDSEDVIVLTAHYDHVGVRGGQIYNGADDNASGTATALEIARQVAAEPLRNTLVIALVDAEETGLAGAAAFVRNPPIARDRIALNVNLDMVSRSDGTLWAAGGYHTPALRPVLRAVADQAEVDLRLGHDRPDVPGQDDWTSMSDHAPFHRAGIPFVYFGVEDHQDYHQPTDDFERVDPGDFVASARTILMALRQLDAAFTP